LLMKRAAWVAAGLCLVAECSAWSLGATPLSSVRAAHAEVSRAAVLAVAPPPEKEEGLATPKAAEPEQESRFASVVPSNLIEGSEAPEDFVSQVPVQPPITLPAWAEEGPIFRRAEFWDNRMCTKMEILNVLGRWESATEWADRDFFITVSPKIAKKEVEDNSWTRQRYEMAKRMNTVERVALIQNCEKLPFTNEKLAASVGKTVDDFNALPVSRAAVDVVYDALAESRASLIPPTLIDSRKNSMINDDGSFNEVAFRLGLYKSRALVIFAWFMFGKGNFVWILVGAQFLHDARPDLFPTPKDLELFKWFAIV